MSSEEDVARLLTEFLTKPQGSSWNSTVPVKNYVETQIKAICRDIAAEVVKANPAVNKIIRERVEWTIREVLAKDDYLNEKVTSAVAQAISNVALERAGEED